MKALYDNLKAWGRPLFATLHQIGSSKTGTNSIQKLLIRRHPSPVAIAAARRSEDKKLWWVELGTSFANVGDVIRFPGYGIECDVVDVDDDTGEVAVRTSFQGNLQAGITEALVLYYSTPELDSTANAAKVAASTVFQQDGADIQVSKDTSNPTDAIGLPVEVVPMSVKEYRYLKYADESVSDFSVTQMIAATAFATKKVIVSETSGQLVFLTVNNSPVLLIPRGGIEIDHYIPEGSELGLLGVAAGVTINEGDFCLNLVG